MQPSSMQEHHREEGQEVSGYKINIAGEITRGNESEARDEMFKLGGRHADRDEEDGAIGRNQRPCNDGWISRCHRILDREHRSGTILRDRKANCFPLVRRQPRKFNLSRAPVATLTRVKLSIRGKAQDLIDDLRNCFTWNEGADPSAS